MQMYEPSLDWANELVGSLVWTAKAWVITAVVTVVVLVLLARLTTWGRQFWRVTGGYFRGRESVIVWAWLGALLFVTLISVRLSVLLSYQSNDLYSSLQVAFEGAGAGNEAVRDSGVRGFWTAILTFALMWRVFGADSLATQGLFQSGWFVVGLLTQVMVVHLIRTPRLPFIESRAATPLVVMSLVVAAVGVLMVTILVVLVLVAVAVVLTVVW